VLGRRAGSAEAGVGAPVKLFLRVYLIQGELIHENGIEDVVGNSFVIWDILLVPGGLCEKGPAGKERAI